MFQFRPPAFIIRKSFLFPSCIPRNSLNSVFAVPLHYGASHLCLSPLHHLPLFGAVPSTSRLPPGPPAQPRSPSCQPWRKQTAPYPTPLNSRLQAEEASPSRGLLMVNSGTCLPSLCGREDRRGGCRQLESTHTVPGGSFSVLGTFCLCWLYLHFQPRAPGSVFSLTSFEGPLSGGGSGGMERALTRSVGSPHSCAMAPVGGSLTSVSHL